MQARTSHKSKAEFAKVAFTFWQKMCVDMEIQAGIRWMTNESFPRISDEI
jgi:hypothetical protein